MGLTWEELADRAGLSVQGLRNIRTGLSQPRLATYRKLEVALELPEGALSSQRPWTDAHFHTGGDQTEVATSSVAGVGSVTAAEPKVWVAPLDPGPSVRLEPGMAALELVVVVLRPTKRNYDKDKVVTMIRRYADDLMDLIDSTGGEA